MNWTKQPPWLHFVWRPSFPEGYSVGIANTYLADSSPSQGSLLLNLGSLVYTPTLIAFDSRSAGHCLTPRSRIAKRHRNRHKLHERVLSLAPSYKRIEPTKRIYIHVSRYKSYIISVDSTHTANQNEKKINAACHQERQF